MGQGFVADTGALAIRVGELQAVAGEVETAAGVLEVSAGNLGPGDITAAVQEVVAQWRDGLEQLRGKIETIAENVRGAAANYDLLEQFGEDRMRQLTEGQIVESQLRPLRGAVTAHLAGPGQPKAEG